MYKVKIVNKRNIAKLKASRLINRDNSSDKFWYTFRNYFRF